MKKRYTCVINAECAARGETTSRREYKLGVNVVIDPNVHIEFNIQVRVGLCIDLEGGSDLENAGKNRKVSSVGYGHQIP